MNKISFLTQSLMPGVALILLAFFAGLLPHPVFSLLGFLSFFVGGITIIIEGWKKSNNQ